MKPLLLLFCLSLVACKSQEVLPENCYKGRLALKGICNNYVIELVEGTIDTSRLEAQWKNPDTGKFYTNAFALSNPCALPVSLKEGDEFFFKLDSTQLTADCITCKAYSPTPRKSLPVSVCP
ncbi:hypothetical protein V7S74_05735 [Aquirufa sp. 2-AUSEE-184A6]|uniref:Lipoprotein n=1 Tax=Aquirufa novilacunae TaxID=3139305 RepID=A0ABW8SY46_9BACT